MVKKRNEAIKKSVVNIKIEVNSRTLNNKKLKKFAIAFVLTIAMATASLTNITQNIFEDVKIHNYTEEQRRVVASETHPTSDGKHFWYDNSAIAKYLLEQGPENFDENLFGVYHNIGYNHNNKVKMTNEILEIVNRGARIHPEYGFETGYNNLDEYLVANGFVDKEGKPSLEKYEEYMKTILIAKAENKSESTDWGMR